MKKIFLFTALLFIVAFGAFELNASGQLTLKNLFYYSFCDQPIHYRIDTVDPKFNLSREEFSTDINQAVQIWNNSIDKNLFIYDPKGDLSINLIYDERQTLTNQINQLENTLQSEKGALNPKIDEYEKAVSDFKKKIEELNKKIEEWNSKGGAPPDEYNKITQEQKSLQTEADRLNAMAQSLNISTRAYNTEVGKLNQTISNFNSALEEKPEEGIYKGEENRIEIYFNISKTELVHTISHELGHALGLEHVNNPKAIMYSKTNQSLTPTDDDLSEIKDLCRERSVFEFIQNYISQLMIKYKLVN